MLIPAREDFKRECFAIFSEMEERGKDEGCVSFATLMDDICITLDRDSYSTFWMAKDPLFEEAAIEFFGDEFAVNISTDRKDFGLRTRPEMAKWMTFIKLKPHPVSE